MPVTATSALPSLWAAAWSCGPRPCDYTKKVNKSTRRLALRRVLGDLIAASKVSTVRRILCR